MVMAVKISGDANSRCLLDDRHRILNRLLGDPHELTVFGFIDSCRCLAVMLWISCMRRRALRVRLVNSKGLGSMSVELANLPGNNTLAIPQQSTVGGVMNVGFDDGGVVTLALYDLDI